VGSTSSELEAVVRRIVRDELAQFRKAQLNPDDMLKLIAQRLGGGVRPARPAQAPPRKPASGSQRSSLRVGILSLLRDSEAPIGARAIANSLSKDNSSNPFQGALKSLVRDGLVNMSGQRRATVYELTDKGRAGPA
jgi:hypothetical protein